jgi:hypothetical protein
VRQTTELSRVKARIKALAEKTVSNGCTEAEAMAAADMVGRLLERYALSMEEIGIARDLVVPSYVFFGFEADTAMAGYLFSVISRAPVTCRANASRTHKLSIAARCVWGAPWRSPYG